MLRCQGSQENKILNLMITDFENLQEKLLEPET